MTPVFLPGEFQGQKCLEGYSPWGCKESEMTEQLTLSLYEHKKLISDFVRWLLSQQPFFWQRSFYL